MIAVNPDTLVTAGRFRLRSPMQSIKVDPNTDFVYLAAPRDFVVGLYDPFSFGPVDFLDTHGPIADMATDGDENNLYLVSDEASRVVVFQRIRKRIVGELDVGAGPSRIAVMGEN